MASRRSILLESRFMTQALLSDGLFSPDEIETFNTNGYLVVPGLGTDDFVRRMIEVTRRGLEFRIPPLEFEAEVKYPGAPESFEAPGGTTVRRLKQALTRDFVFTEWLTQPCLLGRLQQLLGPQVICPLAHHNCIMTKEPAFSSETGWHQDTRYWSFTDPNLINTWLALGPERPENGCLKVIPGSHRLQPTAEQLDAALFFREDYEGNQPWLRQARHVPLDAGDVLFFHARLLHAASRNLTSQTKLSVVFTFRGSKNVAVQGTRSAAYPELHLVPSA